MSTLFSPFAIKDLELKNRIFVAPMCQYSGVDGLPGSWHLQHYGALAVGGAGAITLEATAVEAAGRISPGCLGLYNDTQEAALTRLVTYMRDLSPIRIGLQIAHAGRKASCRTWKNGKKDGKSLTAEEGAWETFGPSALPFGEGYAVPTALDANGIERVAAAFAASTRRALRAGLDFVELHLAHGYLLSSFLSPLSNQRRDQYGGTLENRMRLPLDVVSRMRAAWPAHKPLGVRINAHDWADNGVTFDETLQLCDALKAAGVDFICISAGVVADGVRIPAKPGYLVPLAAQVKQRTGLPTRVPGLLFDPRLAEEIVASGSVDCVAIGRAMLFDPRWPLHAAQRLGVTLPYPLQYLHVQPETWPGAAFLNG